MEGTQDPDQPTGLGSQMPTQYPPPPPQNGVSNGPVPQPVPSFQQPHVPRQTLQYMQNPPVQMTPCEPEEQSGTDRHLFKLTPHVEIAYDDTFKESETAKGFDFMKDVNQSVYEYTHFGVYAALSLVFAPLMTSIWGVLFALTHVVVIWMVQPMIKFIFIWFRIMSMFFSASVRLFFDPCFRSISLVFSSIKGRFRMDESDITLNVKTSQIQHV